MKRIFSIVLLALSFVLCSCNADTATTYNSKSIDNGYNNYLAGGNMAYKDSNLYVNFTSDNYMTLGTYKFSNAGVSQILADENIIGSYAFEMLEFYQFKDKIYAIKDKVYVYDESDDKLTESEYDEIFDYISDDLNVVCYDDELIVKYKDKPEYTIEDVYEYYVKDNIIYIINCDGRLYCNDAAKGDSESVFLNSLIKSYVDFLHVCGDNVYFNFDAAYYDEFETGLYSYSISDDSYKFILEGEINCLNSFDNVLYIATDKGIYKCESDKVEKITDRSAKEIYLLDEDWIYAVQNDAGNVYRVSLDGEKVEIVNFI